MTSSSRRSIKDLLGSLLGGLSGRLAAGGGDALLSARRETGRPASANGASSFHLWWEMPPVPLVEVSAVLEILEPPRVPALYFWALQVEFVENGRRRGGAHTGLQWYPRFPGSRAVNWGGYASAEEGGRELTGTSSALPGLPGERNTFSYWWEPGRAYRLRVYRAPEPGMWRADIADLEAGCVKVIRDLHSSASFVGAPLVWSEVFADCDAPPVSVRWSHFEAIGAGGSVLHPSGVTVSYQAVADGGCSNTDVLRESDGFLQATNTERTTPPGTSFAL